MKKHITLNMDKLKHILKKAFSSIKFVAGFSFIIGLILGYCLGPFKILPFLLNTLSKIHFDFSGIKWLIEISPNETFLSDIAAFEAAIIAFLVPLSIEIVSKLSERYQSDVITRTFENKFENKYLPIILLINVVVAIVLRFVAKENVTNHLVWKIITWVILIAFIYVAYAIWRVINRIKIFMSNTQAVIDQLNNNIKRALE